MKTTLFKKMFTVLMAIVLTVSFCPTGAFSFTVSAEGLASHVTIDNVHYYVVAPAVNGVQPSVTIDLGDGAKTYKTQTFTSAYTAAGGATGQTSVIALTEGYYSVTEPASAGTAAKVSIIGYGTSADKIIVDTTTWFRAQFPMYLNNFTLHTGEAQSFVGASWLECGPTFRSTGWTLWAPWAYQANAYTGTDHKAVIDGTLVYGKYFAAFGAGDFVKQTALGGQGHLYEVTINNLMMGDYVYTDCGRILLGNYRASLTYTGNYIFTINNATPHDTTPYVDVSKAAGAVTTFNGTATLILNNGMASKWTVTDEAKAAVDYCVIVPENGYVTVTEETKKATVPTFEIAAPEGKTPIIDGKEIELVGGKYLYTPATTGTINVFFVGEECDHTYNNDCDTDCNVCGDVREVGDHVYDNDYDADCNVCGDVREVPDKPIVPVDGPLFVVDNATAKVGDTFTVTVRTEKNTGIVAFKVEIGYDATLLELVSIEGQDFAGTTYGPLTNNPISVSWVDALNPNNQTNGVIATLTFRVKEDAPEGATAITVTYPPDDVYDYDFENVTFGTVDGTIDIINYISGDVNDDGIVNNKDIGLMQRYINGWGNEIDERAADVTGDGMVNNKDIGILQRYINGWGIELQS